MKRADRNISFFCFIQIVLFQFLDIKMIKIGDLITIPDVKTVIELAHIRDAELLKIEDEQLLREIAQTFVVTEDIKQNIESILQSMSQNQGRGFFLSGSFGSGKSHFLSVISLLLSYKKAWQPLVEQEPSLESFQMDLKGKKYAIVQIPLLEHSSPERLEDIIFAAIELTLNKRWNLPITLTEDHTFIERFEKFVLPAKGVEVDEFIHKELGSQFSWETLRDEPGDLVALIKKFIDTCSEEIPFQLTPRRGPGLNKTMNTLSDQGIHGLVILLDELSEFLKSKETSAHLNEDARFLQFLGERSLNQPIWIIGALQESIEKTGDIQKAVFDKIKDRYKTRLELSTRHIRELIDRRLVLKKETARSTIQEAFTILKNSFNNIKITADSFHQIYPVHPESIELLNVLTDLFSQRRGIVDFVHYQLKGDPSRHISGILNEDYLQLLTPDKIFDHFYVQIKENPQTSKLYTIYREQFQKRIPEIFDDKDDANGALKTIKILILLQIVPIKMERNVQELANMILHRTTELTLGDINYEYFEENILKRLERELGYLKLEKHEGKFQDIYRFDVESTAIDIIQERLKAAKTQIRGKKREVIDAILPNLASALFPWRSFIEIENHRNYIKWMNSAREGRVVLTNILSLEEDTFSLIYRRLKDEEDDFYIIFGYPYDLSEQRSAFLKLMSPYKMSRLHGAIIHVLPTTIPQNEWDILEDAYCTRLVLEEFTNEDSETSLEIKEKLGESLKALEREARRIIEESYTSGQIFTASGELDCSVYEVTDQNFNAIITRLIDKPLDDIFPLFHVISPLEEVSSNIILKELLHQFIRPGIIEDINSPQYRMLRQAIENIMVPLGIAEIKGSKANLSVDIKTSAGLKAIYDRVGEDQPIGYHELYWHLRKSEFGMTMLIFDLLLSVLIRKGHIIALQENHSVSFYNLQFPLFKYMDSINRGRLIDSHKRMKLQVITKALIRENLVDYDIQKQEEVWEKLRDFRDRAGKFLEKANQQMKSMVFKYKIDENEALPLTMGALKALSDLISSVNPTMDSRRGLENLLEKIDRVEKMQDIMAQTKVLGKFLDSGLSELEQIHSYIYSPHLVIPDSESYQEMRNFLNTIKGRLKINDAFILEDGLRYIRGLFVDFLDLYKNRYAQEHDLMNRAIDVEALQYLEDSDAFSLLRKFAQISLISVPDDFTKIHKLIQGHRSRACNVPVAESLQRFPRCQCGFKLGTPIEPVNFKQLKLMLQAGLRQYIGTLKENLYRTQIVDYLNKMEMLQQPLPKAEIQTLLDLDPAADIESLQPELKQCLTQEAIEHINKAISGDVVIVTRYIDELYENLIDRKYPKDKVRQIFDEWIEGKEQAGEGVYLEIVSKTEKKE